MAPASARSVSSEHSGRSTEASAARRATTPDVSALSGVSLAVEPAGRSRSDVSPLCAGGSWGSPSAVQTVGSVSCRAPRADGAPASTSITLSAASPQSAGGCVPQSPVRAAGEAATSMRHSLAAARSAGAESADVRAVAPAGLPAASAMAV
eukprot:6209483-Pleurochrysis_carterae.AAC.3